MAPDVLTGATAERSLRTAGRLTNQEGFNELVVAVKNGVPIRIKDLGRAEDGTKEPRSLGRLNGQPAVVLEIRRQSGANTVAVIEDIKANPGEKAFVFIHTVPYEGSVALVNLLTSTRLVRKGFDVNIILYGPGVLLASGTRGFPAVGQEAFPGHMAINNQIKTLIKEGATVYACRFAMGALYGFREDDLIEGVKPFHPLDVLDSALTAWRAGAFQINTWTV